MASRIEDLSSLEGQAIKDQMGRSLGKVKHIYTVGDGDDPEWVTVETSIGIGGSRVVFVPIARLKEEEGEIRVPYSTQHVQASPELEPEKELSANDERLLRDYYAIDHADEEIRTDNEGSYAAQVSERDKQPQRKD